MSFVSYPSSLTNMFSNDEKQEFKTPTEFTRNGQPNNTKI